MGTKEHTWSLQECPLYRGTEWLVPLWALVSLFMKGDGGQVSLGPPSFTAAVGVGLGVGGLLLSTAHCRSSYLAREGLLLGLSMCPNVL